ncbi:MAG TPA: prenyltransferase/squalene oxidase repeat-containing protein, partial [Actinomycetota bacterium]
MTRSVRRFAALACLVVVSGTAQAKPAVTPASKAIRYVAQTQAPDGTFFGGGQSVAYSGGLADTLVSLSADTGLRRGRLGPALAQLQVKGPEEMTRAAYAARAVMALVAVGRNPRSFGGYDYVAKLDSYSGAGAWEGQMYANAIAALGALAAHGSIPDEAVLWFRATQCPDGGWGWFSPCVAADVDTTALVVNVLAGAGLPSSDLTLARARDYLIAAQNEAGGFGAAKDQETNANSTGLALSAIAALGEHP